jgi:hypothetical protein
MQKTLYDELLSCKYPLVPLYGIVVLPIKKEL